MECRQTRLDSVPDTLLHFFYECRCVWELWTDVELLLLGVNDTFHVALSQGLCILGRPDAHPALNMLLVWSRFYIYIYKCRLSDAVLSIHVLKNFLVMHFQTLKSIAVNQHRIDTFE